MHRDFCEVAICERGRARSAGRIDTTREALELFAASLAPDDRVVLESTGNALAIANILRGHVAEVVLANPMQVRAISHAKVKNDRVDARTLAELLAADLLPQVWIADELDAGAAATHVAPHAARPPTHSDQERGVRGPGPQPDRAPAGQRSVRQGRPPVDGDARAARR